MWKVVESIQARATVGQCNNGSNYDMTTICEEESNAPDMTVDFSNCKSARYLFKNK